MDDNSIYGSGNVCRLELAFASIHLRTVLKGAKASKEEENSEAASPKPKVPKAKAKTAKAKAVKGKKNKKGSK